MSTAASISQFMAILGGGANPTPLKQTTPDASVVDFQSLLNSDGTPKTQQKTTPNLNGQLIAQGNIPDNANAANTPSAVKSSGIWQFIQQQAGSEGHNSIVLNLAGRGIPQDIVDELTGLFDTTDLITILRDPQLSAQLDQALTSMDLNNASPLIATVNSLLIQNTDSVEELTFEKSEITSENIIDKIIDILEGSSTGDLKTTNEEMVYIAQPVIIVAPKEEIPQRLNLTVVQQEIINNGDALLQQSAKLQNTPEITSGISPFAMKNVSDLSPEAQKKLEQSAMSPGMGSYKSIADRIGNGTHTQNNNGSAGGNSSSTPMSPHLKSIVVSGDGQEFLLDGDVLIPFEAGFKTASQATNPLLSQPNSTQSHQASQAVAISLTKMAENKGSDTSNQRYRIQLSPPEMGKLDIEMNFIDGGKKVKTVITVDRPETLGLLQRDMHVLLKSLQDAGFENISNQDLSFNLSQGDQNASNANDQNNDNSSDKSGKNNSTDPDMEIIESEMSIIIDPITGQQSINMLV